MCFDLTAHFQMKYFYFLFIICSYLSSYSQVRSNSSQDISRLMSAFDTLRSISPSEKLYLHFDKRDYITGDTLWFKAYSLEGAYLTASEKSGLFYLELVNDSNEVIRRMKFPLKYGLSWGNIVLDAKEIPAGSYTLRAYTNWMRNFGEDALFSRSIHIAAPSEQSWLVNADAQIIQTSNKDYVKIALQFGKLDKKPVGLREMELRVMEGRKPLYSNKVQTRADGSLDVNFDLPKTAEAKDIRIVAEDLRKGEGNRQINVPLQLNRASNTDLQFMPEGGNLIVGIPSKVGFKAVGKDGKGIQVEGKILNSKQQEVVLFKSAHKGMGSFELTPEPGESYLAQLSLKDGIVKTYPLPEIETTGTVLSVTNPAESDEVEVRISASADIRNSTTSYYLIAQARGVVCFAKAIRFNGKVLSSQIPKSIFPSGITRFTLLNENQQPLNERIIYIDHNDNLNISIASERTLYQPRDSIALAIEVKDKEGKPVLGSFSLSVTDNKQVKADRTSGTISNYLLLASNLRGHIEDPNYYSQSTAESEIALDDLLLTQGWVGYDWKDVFDPKTPQYAAEPEFTITGNVSNTFGAIRNAKVITYSQKPLMLLDTVTDGNGRFVFKDLPMADSTIYKIQAFNRNGKSFDVQLEVDEWQPPVFSSKNELKTNPWYLNADSAMLNAIRTTSSMKQQEAKLTGRNVLQEVAITAKKTIKGSYNLNGPGGADQVLDAKDIQNEGKISLLDLLHKRIAGFGIGNGKVINSLPEVTFKIKSQKVKFIIDGIDADMIYNHNAKFVEFDVDANKDEGPTEHFNFIKAILSNYTAEDILGIEVMYNMRYNVAYHQRFLTPKELLNLKVSEVTDWAYLEITTRNGKGPFVNKTQGVYVYKPLPFSLPKQFYSPKYALKNKSNPLPDIRSTVHWEPNVITDAEGKATISFYSSDKSTTYSIVMEGSDMNGKAGSVVKDGFIKIMP